MAATGEGALPELDRGRFEGVAQPREPQPWHTGQQWHPKDRQQNLSKVISCNGNDNDNIKQWQ